MEQITIDQLHSKLWEGEVNFTYKKKDGTNRTARGTLKNDLIPEPFKMVENFVNVKASNPKYFDLDKNGWRSLSYDSSTVTLNY